MNQNHMTSALRSCTQASNKSSMGQDNVEGCARCSAVTRRPLDLSPLHLSQTCTYLCSMGPTPPANTLTPQDLWCGGPTAGCKTYLVSEHQQDSICDLIQHCSSAISLYCIQPNTEGSQWPATYLALCRGWQKLSQAKIHTAWFAGAFLGSSWQDAKGEHYFHNDKMQIITSSDTA